MRLVLYVRDIITHAVISLLLSFGSDVESTEIPPENSQWLAERYATRWKVGFATRFDVVAHEASFGRSIKQMPK